MTVKFTERPKTINISDFKNFNPKHSKILDHTFDSYGVIYKGTGCTEDWEHDYFSVLINSVRFAFKTGLGHRTQQSYKRLLLPPLVNAPTIDDVLYALTIDAQLGVNTFSDFCDDLGYDEGSRKALKMYLECQETFDKVSGILPVSLDQAIELFNEY